MNIEKHQFLVVMMVIMVKLGLQEQEEKREQKEALRLAEISAKTARDLEEKDLKKESQKRVLLI